jgi:hypothetical protein
MRKKELDGGSKVVALRKAPQVHAKTFLILALKFI